MADQNYNSGTEWDSSPSTRSKKLNGTGWFFLVTTIVFLGAGIYLFAENSRKTTETATLNTELSSSETRYTDLDAKYTSALADIESFKGKNATLDSMLATREKYILNLKSNLSKEKKTRQLGEAEYQRQVSDLNTMITDLNSKLEQLTKENQVLHVQKDSLGNDITQKQTAITELQTTNSTLTQKVTVASLLVPTEIEASAVRAKSSGKEVETSKASKAEQLKVCFDVPQNKVSDVGQKTFFVRIISPEGVVLAVQNEGSGTLTSVESGETMQYTTTASVDYQQQQKSDVCANWSQATPLKTGNYTAEIYQDGYLVGKKAFELK